MRRYGLWVLAIATACGGAGGDDDGSGEDVTPDASPDADPGVIDCWDSVSCRDGVVYRSYGSDSDSGDDPTCGYGPVSTCADGCDAEGSSFFDDDAFGVDDAQLCAGAADRAVGDPCFRLGPCWPTHAATQPDGTVTQGYLACDSEAAQCVETAPPAIDGWLAPCAAYEPVTGPFEGMAEGGYYGACLVDQDGVDCSVSVQSLPCNGDWECPDGATCDSTLSTTSTRRFAVCRPGPRGAPLDLGCR
jgi:hypothetical protein